MYLENCTVWCKLHNSQILSFEDIVILYFQSGGRHFETNTKDEKYKTQFISQKHS